MEVPKISIITINYNNREGLSKTMDSLWNKQNYKNFEQIIIDGESNDHSQEIIKQYKNKIAYWVSEKDLGIYNAMNKGLTHAKGEYLLFLNSGDWLEVDILSKIYKNLKDYDLIYGDLNLHFKNKIGIQLKTYPSKITASYLYHDSLPHPATFIKRELIQSEKYNESLKIVSDWEFFFKSIIINNRSYRHINLTITNFDMTGISSQKENGQLILKEKKTILDSFFPPLINSDLNQLYVLNHEYLEQPLGKILPHVTGMFKFQQFMILIFYSFYYPYKFIILLRIWILRLMR